MPRSPARRSPPADGRQAEKLVGRFIKDHPGPDAARLLAELEDAQESGRRGAESAALDEGPKGADDGLLAVEIRDALTEHLRGDRLADLDRDLVRWLVGEIRAEGPLGADQARRSRPCRPGGRQLRRHARRGRACGARSPTSAAPPASALAAPDPYPGARRRLPALPGARRLRAPNPAYVPLSGETDPEESP